MNLTSLKSMKNSGKKITMLTCYDASFAKILESINVHALLVGDSLGMFIKGDINTHNVSLNDMIYHTRAVAQGAKSTFIISDLPIHTYENNDLAYKSALALIEVGAYMVKLEGGAAMAPIIAALTRSGVPVIGHIGLTPQSVLVDGKPRARGKQVDAALQLLDDARALVTENRRKQPFGIRAGTREFIGMTDSGGLDFDQHLAGTRAVEFDCLDRERGTRFMRDCGFHLHEFLLFDMLNRPQY